MKSIDLQQNNHQLTRIKELLIRKSQELQKNDFKKKIHSQIRKSLILKNSKIRHKIKKNKIKNSKIKQKKRLL